VLRSLRDELIKWRSESNWHSCWCCSSCIFRSVHASSQACRFSSRRTVTLWISCWAGIWGSWKSNLKIKSDMVQTEISYTHSV
jgi:hypothetical protein